MFWRLMMAPLLALFAFSMLADTASAQPRDRTDRGPPGFDRDRGPPGYDRGRGPDRGREQWELLGEQSVGFGVDRDVIRVGRREGRFSALALEVRDNDVEILDLNVFFNRGPPQSLRVREFIRAGGRTRPIQFAWGDRSIDRIEITYRARPSFRGRAKVAVFGLQRCGAAASAAAVGALGGARLRQGGHQARPRLRSASGAVRGASAPSS